MECTPFVQLRSSPPPPPGLENRVQLGPASGGARPAPREPATAVANPHSTQAKRGAGWSWGGRGNGGKASSIDMYKMTVGQGSAINLVNIKNGKSTLNSIEKEQRKITTKET